MRSTFLIITCLLMAGISISQSKTLLALPIHYEPDPIAGGDLLLLVQKPKGILLKEGQTFVCKSIYRPDISDTATIGSGYVRSILTDEFECIIPAKELKDIPLEGDLCYFLIAENISRTDLFYKPARYAINFSTVAGELLLDAPDCLGEWPAGRSDQLLRAMAEDIRFTGKTMKAQADAQQQQIKTGKYDGQMLFDAMQTIQAKDVEAFMRFVNAQPSMYAGGHWSIAEVFATWMTNGTP